MFVVRLVLFACATLAGAPALAAGCLLAGDSIAVGLEKFEPHCMVAAANGATSDAIVAMAPPDAGFARVIVSMGTNDWRLHAPLAANLAANLATLRQRYPRARFTWIGPNKGQSATVVADFAAEHHDALVRLSDQPSRDSVHPSNFADLAARLQ